jgi:hypothetical protein
MRATKGERVWSRYRAFRRGIVALPHLERVLRRDRKELGMIAARGRLSEAEIAFFVQSLETIRESVEETIDGLRDLKRLLGAGAALDDEALQTLLSRMVKDDRTRTRMLRMARWNGGVRQLFENAAEQLELKRRVYTNSGRMARVGRASSVKRALKQLDAYDASLEKTRERWREQMPQEDDSSLCLQLTIMRARLCWEYPDIADRLGVECFEMDPIPILWPFVFILVVALVLSGGYHI